MPRALAGSPTGNKGFGLVSLMLIVVMIGIAAAVVIPLLQKTSSSDVVTLRFDRPSALLCGSCNADIYVNNIKLGTIANGISEVFVFRPNTNGRNELQVRLVRWFDKDIDSDVFPVGARAGATAHAYLDITSLNKQGTVVRVGVEPVGQARSTGRAMLDSVLDAATEQGPARLPWEAIYAVAAVVGAAGVLWFCFR